jgi:transposase
MNIYAGLDVSDKVTHICVVDADGRVLWRDVCASAPEVLARVLKKRCPGLVRVVLETGSLSAFLYHGLVERGVPAMCIWRAPAGSRRFTSDVNGWSFFARRCRATQDWVGLLTTEQ